METGKSLGYSLFNLQDRGQLIIGPATDVYIGMIVGINNRDNDLNVNPCKNKEMSNTRSKSSDEAIALVPPKTFSLEEALEFINDDEYVEITPAVIRLRKKILDPKIVSEQIDNLPSADFLLQVFILSLQDINHFL